MCPRFSFVIVLTMINKVNDFIVSRDSLINPHFFFGRSLPFLTLFIILKNKKNLCVGSFNYFSYTIKRGSNWYLDTGVRDLKVVFLKANSS